MQEQEKLKIALQDHQNHEPSSKIVDVIQQEQIPKLIAATRHNFLFDDKTTYIHKRQRPMLMHAGPKQHIRQYPAKAQR